MKNTLLILCCSLFAGQLLFAQNVGIGTSTPHPSAQLEISSNSKGLLMPRMASGTINSITNPAKGLMVYDSSLNRLVVNAGTVSSPDWQPIANNNGWNITGNSGTDPGVHFIGTTDNKPLYFRINNNYAGRIDSVNESTSLGYRAGRPGGGSNTAIGYKSFFTNTAGQGNTAIGSESLLATTNGSHNVASGFQALYSNTTGSYNAAHGSGALGYNTTGYFNAANGYLALLQNTDGFSNTASGAYSLFKNTAGYHNTGAGYGALFGNTTGNYNTSLGSNSLYSNTTGNYNVANGYGSLYANSTGHDNVALGVFSLYLNTSGVFNTATGAGALYNNIIGNDNVAVGVNSLFSNSTGSKNSATGWQALYANTTGYYNAAYGDGAIHSNTTGVGNTAIGSGALYTTTVSHYNTAVGYHAGFENDLGWNNTLIGAESKITGSGIYNGIAIGNGTFVNANSQARIGNYATASIGGYANWTYFSDGRYKKNIKEDVKGLEFIMKLRPVTYQFDVFGLSSQLNKKDNKPVNDMMKTAMMEKEKEILTGFIAQEVESAAKSLGYDFSGVDKPKNENDYYGLRYAEFVVPLVKAMQEQQKIIENQQRQIGELVKRLEVMERNTVVKN